MHQGGPGLCCLTPLPRAIHRAGPYFRRWLGAANTHLCGPLNGRERPQRKTCKQATLFAVCPRHLCSTFWGWGCVVRCAGGSRGGLVLWQPYPKRIHISWVTMTTSNNRPDRPPPPRAQSCYDSCFVGKGGGTASFPQRGQGLLGRCGEATVAWDCGSGRSLCPFPFPCPTCSTQPLATAADVSTHSAVSTNLDHTHHTSSPHAAHPPPTLALPLWTNVPHPFVHPRPPTHPFPRHPHTNNNDPPGPTT